MRVPERLEHGPHDVAPHRGEVVALVEHDGRDAVSAQRRDALAGARAEQLRELHPVVLAARDLALQRGDDPRELTAPALGGGAGPGRRLGADRGLVTPRGPSAFDDPAALRERGQRGLGILELRERLVGQAGDRGAGLAADEPGALGPEAGRGAQPLTLDRRVRREHERRTAQTSDHLDSQQRLARARRRDDVRATAAVLDVALEGLQREALVTAPLAREREPADVGWHRVAVPAWRGRGRLPLDGGVDLVEQRGAVAEVEVLREVLVGLLA